MHKFVYGGRGVISAARDTKRKALTKQAKRIDREHIDEVVSFLRDRQFNQEIAEKLAWMDRR